MNTNEYSWRRWMIGVVVAILVFILIAWLADLAGRYLNSVFVPVQPTPQILPPQILPAYDPGLGLPQP